jgi:predicted enzyme related to lactoylglutathione lyase
VNVNSLIINITSENPQALFAFYRDVVGLPERHDMGENAVTLAGAALAFDGHSELSGKAKEPYRYLFNYNVDDLASEEARLTAAGVPCIRSQGREYWGGVISTFVDPDGNYFQLMEYKGE